MLIYQKIAQMLRADLAAGRLQLATGNRLPGARSLEQTYGASRQTVMKALHQLAEEGVIALDERRGARLIADRAALTEGDSLPRRIGFVAPFSGSQISQMMVRGISRVARRRGYDVLLADCSMLLMDVEMASVEALVAAGARGVVVCPGPRRPGEAQRDYLCAMGYPVPLVLTDMAVAGQGHTQVLFDNERAGYSVTSHLVREGRRRIAILGEPPGWVHASLAARRRGYLAALRDHGIPVEPDLIRPFCSPGQGLLVAAHVDEWVRSGKLPDAIIGAEDVVAMEVIDVLEARGLRCPEDVRVFGFDNRADARRYRTPFPTTNPDFGLMGEIACDALIDEVETGVCTHRTYLLQVPVLLDRLASGADHGVGDTGVWDQFEQSSGSGDEAPEGA